jgi:hypothetical protein
MQRGDAAASYCSTRAAALAAEILLWSDRIAERARSANLELRAADAQDPCSEQNVELMRGLAIRSNLPAHGAAARRGWALPGGLA